MLVKLVVWCSSALGRHRMSERSLHCWASCNPCRTVKCNAFHIHRRVSRAPKNGVTLGHSFYSSSGLVEGFLLTESKLRGVF